MLAMPWRIVGALVIALAACGPGAAPVVRDEGPPPSWTGLWLATRGADAAIFAEVDGELVGFGQLGAGTIVEIIEEPRGETARCRVRGPLEVDARCAIARLGIAVTRAQELRAGPGYLAIGDIVAALGPPRRGRAPVRVTIAMPDGSAPRVYETELDARDVSHERPDAEAPGHENYLPADRGAALCESPMGAAIVELPPASLVRVIEQRGQWMRVLVGEGPFLVGWIEDPGVAPPGPRVLDASARVARGLARGSEPMVRVRAGATMSVRCVEVGVLRVEAGARLLDRDAVRGVVHVRLAADDRATLEVDVPSGMIGTP